MIDTYVASILATVNSAAKYIGVQISLQYADFLCFGYIQRSGIAGLVHFHAAEKDIPETGQFTKERGLMDLTVPCGCGGLTIVVEGKEEQVMSDMDDSRQNERACVGKLPFLKPSDLMNHSLS